MCLRVCGLSFSKAQTLIFRSQPFFNLNWFSCSVLFFFFVSPSAVTRHQAAQRRLSKSFLSVQRWFITAEKQMRARGLNFGTTVSLTLALRPSHQSASCLTWSCWILLLLCSVPLQAVPASFPPRLSMAARWVDSLSPNLLWVSLFGYWGNFLHHSMPPSVFLYLVSSHCWSSLVLSHASPFTPSSRLLVTRSLTGASETLLIEFRESGCGLLSHCSPKTTPVSNYNRAHTALSYWHANGAHICAGFSGKTGL